MLQCAEAYKKRCCLQAAELGVRAWQHHVPYCCSFVATLLQHEVPVQVLEGDASNVKALYRRAQAQLALGYIIEAQMDVKAVLLQVLPLMLA